MLRPLISTFLQLQENLHDLTPFAGRILLGPGISPAVQRANQPEMKHSHLSCGSTIAGSPSVTSRLITRNQSAVPASPSCKENRFKI